MEVAELPEPKIQRLKDFCSSEADNLANSR